MGEKGGKKDKNKADKQKQQQTDKKKEQQKTKLPSKKPAETQHSDRTSSLPSHRQSLWDGINPNRQSRLRVGRRKTCDDQTV